MVEDQEDSRSVLEEAPGPVEPGEGTAGRLRHRAWWKVAVVIVLMAAVGGVIASKTRGGAAAPAPARNDAPPRPSSASQPASEPGVSAERDMALSVVNGEPITLGDLQDVIQNMPHKRRAAFERSKLGLLEEMITGKVLSQEARRQGLVPAGEGDASRESAQAERKAVDDLLRRKTADVLVKEEDLRSYYEKRKSSDPNIPSFEIVRERLRAIVLKRKRAKVIGAYIAGLRAAASITRNETWVQAQKALAADNPLDKALATGRPVVADFGRGACIPCKMMKPILDALKQEYAGRAEIIIIDVDDYPAVTERVGIRTIPTQVFYGAQGEEVYRHQGFMPREAILQKLAEMGVH
ncbi:MAG: thioredoxin fold domain-containing protein [Planctomycetes bacterium]|nr:thioredoxin fold domain-containing protein [Planctomycetota bacterium]